MVSRWDSWFKGDAAANLAPVQRAAGISAQPLIVGAPSDAKLDHARYRIDAIQRTLAQSGEHITATHRAEFVQEIRGCAHMLVQADAMTDANAAALVASVKGA